MRLLPFLFLLGCFPFPEYEIAAFEDKFCPSEELIGIRLGNSKSRKEWDETKEWAKSKCREVGIAISIEDKDYINILNDLKKKYKNKF